jgi:hypothetical protein
MRLAPCHCGAWRLESTVLRPTDTPYVSKPTLAVAACFRLTVRDTQSGAHCYCGSVECRRERCNAASVVPLRRVYSAWRAPSHARPTSLMSHSACMPPVAACLSIVRDTQSGPHLVCCVVLWNRRRRGVQCRWRRAIAVYGAWRAPSYARPTSLMRHSACPPSPRASDWRWEMHNLAHIWCAGVVKRRRVVACGWRRAIAVYGAWIAPSYARPTSLMRHSARPPSPRASD